MTFKDTTYPRMSDLVVHEFDPSVGFSRRDINVTPPANSAPVLIGTPVYRVKSTDLTAAYAVVDNASQLVATNEFAIVYGDEFSFNPEFAPRAIVADQYNAVGFVGTSGALQLKEFYIKERVVTDASLTTANFETLKGLLEAQGIQILKTV